MTIYRGPGGTGSANSDVDTTEFQEFLVQSQAARDAALAAEIAAELAASEASFSASNASTSASSASSNASSASTSATNAATSASSALASSNSAATSASAAAASAASINDTNLVHKTGNETIGGIKTFTSSIAGSVTGNSETVTNGVYTSGSYPNPTWLTSIAGSKVSGNISGNAANVTGTVAVINGGTGSTTAPTARTALGVAIGTDVQAYSANLTTYASTGVSFRNRIINGDMRIDQRNAGASVTPTSSQYSLDRWQYGLSAASKFTTQQSSTAPTGFIKSLLVTSSSAYSVGSGDYFTARQPIEGVNVADLAWGTANAATVTLSFWVRSSLTGTFGGSLHNSAANRSYPFTYTISSANTFEYKTVTIAGDTSGTWLTDTGVGLMVCFGLGVGSTLSGTAGSWAGTLYLSATGTVSVVSTNAATFYITGVQLEAGSVASPFERRDYGRELMMCQRYYWKATNEFIGYTFTGSVPYNGRVSLPIAMRAAPTLEGTSAFIVGLGSVGTVAIATTTNYSVQFYNSSANWTIGTFCTVSAGLTSEL